MRKSIIFVIFITCIFFLGHSQNSSFYTFPFKMGDTKWKQYESANERKKALLIPDSILKNIPTDNLLDLCIQYPYLFDIMLSNNRQDGVTMLFSEFNGYKELLNRRDIIDKLLCKYEEYISRAEVLTNNLSSKDMAYPIQCCLIRYLLVQNEIMHDMTNSQKDLAYDIAEKDLKMQETYPFLFIGCTDMPTALLKNLQEKNIQKNRNDDYYYTDNGVYRKEQRLTPNGSPVNAGVLVTQDYSDSLKTYYKNLIESGYNGVEVIGAATLTYNCHAYAWHIAEGGDSVWIGVNSIFDEDIYWNDGSYIEVPESLATKVSYQYNHSAVRINSNEYISKWGAMSLVRHNPTNVPIYGNPTKYYKRSNPNIMGESFICNSEIYSIQELANIFNVTWSHVNSAFTLTPSGNNCTVSYNQSTPTNTVVDTLKATISRNGNTLTILSKEIYVHGTNLNIVGSQVTSSMSGQLVQNEFAINTSTAVNNTIYADSISLVGDCEITMTSERFKGMDISFSGAVQPTNYQRTGNTITFTPPTSINEYYMTLVAENSSGCSDFDVVFTISPDDNAQLSSFFLALSLDQSQLYLTLQDAAGTPWQQGTWNFTITNVITGQQVHSQQVVGPSATVNISSYASGLYVVNATYDGARYSKKFVKN